MYVVIKRLISCDAERVPKELAASLDQASDSPDAKESLREKIRPVRSARRDRQTVREPVCQISPHMPGRIRASEHENSFRREILSHPYQVPSRPAKKPLPPVKVIFASYGIANNFV